MTVKLKKFPFILIIGINVIISSCSSPKSGFSLIGSETWVAPAHITFKNESQHADYYEWQFGDGKVSESFQPKHIYLLSGRYKVKLSAYTDKKKSTTEKEIIIEAPQECVVAIHTTAGTMIAKLYDDTERHRDNFIRLAENGYYKDMLFHRVIKGFMIQSGDPDSKNADPGKKLGGGGPDYTIKHEIRDTLYHLKGALAAARTDASVNPELESSGSQFYIVHGQTISEKGLAEYEETYNISYPEKAKDIYKSVGGAPSLDKNYTIFGQVIAGFEVIDAIADKPTDKHDRPLEDVKILNIEIIK